MIQVITANVSLDSSLPKIRGAVWTPVKVNVSLQCQEGKAAETNCRSKCQGKKEEEVLPPRFVSLHKFQMFIIV